LKFYPEVVLLPSNSNEISFILSYCNEHRIPVTPRGAGTGLSGGALPIKGGVCLSLERMNKIISILRVSLCKGLFIGVVGFAPTRNAIEFV
jgi:glycolate oxidase